MKTFAEHFPAWQSHLDHVATLARRAKQRGWDHEGIAEGNVMSALDRPLLITCSWRLHKDWANRDRDR